MHLLILRSDALYPSRHNWFLHTPMVGHLPPICNSHGPPSAEAPPSRSYQCEANPVRYKDQVHTAPSISVASPSFLLSISDHRSYVILAIDTTSPPPRSKRRAFHAPASQIGPGHTTDQPNRSNPELFIRTSIIANTVRTLFLQRYDAQDEDVNL